MQVLSYGAGVQTFGILCLIKQGRLPKPDLVIFADTQGEKEETYLHLNYIAKPLMDELGLPFEFISKGNLLLDSFSKGFTPRPPICSKSYKSEFIGMWLKRTYPDVPKFFTWIGISTDEEHRSHSPARVSYIEKRYPLLELDLSRYEVIQAIKEAGLEVPVKSGCWYCPWNSSRPYWMALKRNQPEKFNLAYSIEISTGHKLSNGPFRLGEIEHQATFDQTTFDFDFTEQEDELDSCDTGACFV